MLIPERNGEVGENETDDEHVVHRQRKLDEVAGRELQGVLSSTPNPNAATEHHLQTEPKNRPAQRDPNALDTRASMEQSQIQGEHSQDAGHEHRPLPNRRFNVGQPAKAVPVLGGSGSKWNTVTARSGQTRPKKKEVRATGAKEAGQRMPVEETFCHPNQSHDIADFKIRLSQSKDAPTSLLQSWLVSVPVCRPPS